MRRESSRGPSNRWPGASDDTIQLSTTAPTLEPIMPPMAAAEAPRIEPPIEPPMAVPAAPRTRVAMCGWLRSCKGFLGDHDRCGCGHVFGLLARCV
jgi:hypothetical protein